MMANMEALRELDNVVYANAVRCLDGRNKWSCEQFNSSSMCNSATVCVLICTSVFVLSEQYS